VHLGQDNMIELGILFIGLVVGFAAGAILATQRVIKQYEHIFKRVHADLRDVNSELMAIKKDVHHG
jgi:uncharacterized membrane-anchored protein YhcB (DUF1043 family)